MAVKAESQNTQSVTDENKYWGIEIDFDNTNTLHIDVDGGDSSSWFSDRELFIAVDDPSNDDVQNKIWTSRSEQLHELSLDVSGISGIKELRVGFYWDRASLSGRRAIFQGVELDEQV